MQGIRHIQIHSIERLNFFQTVWQLQRAPAVPQSLAVSQFQPESNRYNKITASHGLSKGMPRNSISCRGKVPSMTRRPSTWIIIQHWAPRPRHFLHTSHMQVRSKHSWRILKWRTATAADLFTREIIDFSVPISSKFCFAFHAMNWLFNTYTPVVAPTTPPKSFSLHYSCCWRTGLAMWQADGMALHQASLPSTPPELKKKEC